MPYAYVIARDSDIAYWIRCRATTLIGAKREATDALRGNYLDAIATVAVIENEHYCPLATRTLRTRWLDIQ